MKKTIWEMRIPTLLGMAIIVVGIVATSFLAKKGVTFLGFASPSQTPENIRITNISDTSLTVSYTTADKVLGSVNFGTTETLGNTTIDDTDENGKIFPRTVHVSTLKNLAPSTMYFFSIISGDTTFLQNGKSFSMATAPRITTQPSNGVQVSGKIVFPNDTNTEGLVYVTAVGTQTLSTTVKPDGSYTISLLLRSQDLSSYISLSENSLLKMLIAGPSVTSTVTLFANQTHPVPTIILSKDYDFTLGTTPIATPSANVNFPSLLAAPASPSAIKNPQIVTPKKNEGFTDPQPVFKGIASPSAQILIEIHSDEQIKTTITADSNGLWTFRPKTPLTPGEHIINIITRDQFGILKTITQSFTVYAQGTQVGQPATPSATLIPTVTPNPSVTPIPTLVPTRPPVGVPTLPPGAKKLPSPGNSFTSLGLGAITTTITGFLLFLLSRGAL